MYFSEAWWQTLSGISWSLFQALMLVAINVGGLRLP